MKLRPINDVVLPLLAVSLLLFSSLVLAARFPGIPAVEDTDYYADGAPSDEKVELGKLLFFDKILSGNLNDSCATCHHPMAWSGDGLSLPVGEGGRGLGMTRDTGVGVDAIHERVPRNAPPVFNLGAREFIHMFDDGRVTIDTDPESISGFISPAGDQLPAGLDNVLAVQAMFPVTSGAEMAGQMGENNQANAAAANVLGGPGGVWDLIAQKLQEVPAYVELFKQAYPEDVFFAEDITYVQAANAIAAFEAHDWRFDNSPFDQFLRGNRRAMSMNAVKGMFLFYGKAGCSDCHSGAFQTDQQFHATAMPQIGPGKGDNLPGYTDGHDDFGREQVTGDPTDRFKFRTPTLRNVALSAPYGHAGAYNTLEAMVRHMLNSVESLHNYDQSQAVLPATGTALDDIDFVVMNDVARREAIAVANELDQIMLKDRDVDSLVAFLHALTDLNAVDLRRDVPASVPSGLPVWE